MKEIKIYLRPDRVEDVVNALMDAGVPHITINHVRSLGSGVDPKHKRLSLETCTWYTEKAKLEFECPDHDVDVLVPVIEMNARTGHAGDGVIIIVPIDRCVKILTGVEGRQALA